MSKYKNKIKDLNLLPKLVKETLLTENKNSKKFQVYSLTLKDQCF